MISRWRCPSTLTHKVPHKHGLLEEPGGLEAVTEELFQSGHQAALPTQQHGQAASLREAHVSCSEIISTSNMVFKIKLGLQLGVAKGSLQDTQ